MSEQAKSPLAAAEEQLLSVWAKEKTFEHSVEQRTDAERFVFYDGPPFANGLPHWGGLMTSALKDAVMRYKTMRGYYAPRRFGWDCHGLPPELLAEKELGVSGKKAIEAYGVEKFNKYCEQSVVRFTDEWHDYVTRIGRWVDFEDDYRTMDPSYMESVIWAFKQLHEKGLVHEGVQVVPYSYGAQTSLSNFETRQDDSYRDREDIAVTFKAQLSDGRQALVWTTVPWTIPSNLLLAVGNDIEYVDYKLGEHTYVVAVEAIERYTELNGGEVIRRYAGSELVGLSYTPVFPYFVGSEKSFEIVPADFVETDSGTGIVSIAPGHGEDDFWLGKKIGVPIVSPVDDAGCFTDEVKDYAGRLVFDANNEILADLEKQGVVFESSLYKHKYPHCWRTDVPIIYRAMSAWFIDVPKIKDQLLAANQEIDWHPSHVKNGAFGKWLENAREWNVSRNRFWGAPLPIWKTDDGELMVMGSIEEIKQHAVDPSLVTDLHRPAIDQVVLKTPSGKLAHRVSDVFDCWFESGSMPFAQLHYPFENKEQFESGHPADFITEYVGQTRGWFYTLHVMSVALFGKPAFKSVVSHGIILGTDNRKMSKRLGNYPELDTTFNQYGADSVRFYLLSSSLFSGETAAFDPKALLEAQRNVIQRLTNVVSFYQLYAKVDGYKVKGRLTLPTSSNVLDAWLLARLSVTISGVTEAADAYDTPLIGRHIAAFIDDLSNWYVRRSRRRFWKSQDDGDKNDAYATLSYALARTCQIMAPWAPFVADTSWRELMAGSDEPASVHLTDWPEADTYDMKDLEAMNVVREAVTQGLAARAQAGIKVRQPLAALKVNTAYQLSEELQGIVADEVNVKAVELTSADTLSVELDTTLTDELRQEGLVRDIIRQVQSARKASGLMVDDRIELSVEGDELVVAAVKKFADEIAQETLAVKLGAVSDPLHMAEATVDGQHLQLRLKKAST